MRRPWIAQRSQRRAYRKLPSLFLMVPSLTTYDLPSPQNLGFHMPPTYANGHISATGDPIHFMFGSRVGLSGTADRTALFTIRTNPRFHVMFCSRVGFSGTADLMALFRVRTNPRWRPPPFWIISNGHISATPHDLLIKRASRGHLCACTAFLLIIINAVLLRHLLSLFRHCVDILAF